MQAVKGNYWLFFAAQSHVSLTTDMWTSRAGDGYMLLTCLFVSSEFEMHHCNLFTHHLPGVHDHVNIAEAVSISITEWRIDLTIFRDCCYSVPSEHLFSVAGMTVCTKRAVLDPANIEKHVFLHSNLEMSHLMIMQSALVPVVNLLYIYSNYDYGICGLQFAPVIGLLTIILIPITSVG